MESITAGPWAFTPELGIAELTLPGGRWDSRVSPALPLGCAGHQHLARLNPFHHL